MESKLSSTKGEETNLEIETLNYKKHLENYKIKMKLLIKKMVKDEEDKKNGVELKAKEIV